MILKTNSFSEVKMWSEYLSKSMSWSKSRSESWSRSWAWTGYMAKFSSSSSLMHRSWCNCWSWSVPWSNSMLSSINWSQDI